MEEICKEIFFDSTMLPSISINYKIMRSISGISQLLGRLEYYLKCYYISNNALLLTTNSTDVTQKIGIDSEYNYMDTLSIQTQVSKCTLEI